MQHYHQEQPPCNSAKEDSQGYRISQVTEQHKRLDQLAALYGKLVEELDAKLSPVMCSNPPSSNEKTQGFNDLCPLAAGLSELAARIDLSNQGLQSILRRLEI